MTEIIRVTQLTSIYTCAFKNKNEPYEPDPRNTYKGDLGNMALTGTNVGMGMNVMLDWYSKNINGDLAIQMSLKTVYEKLAKRIEIMKQKAIKNNWVLFQEAMMYEKIDEENDVRLCGTPDIFVYHGPDEEMVMLDVYDAKVSTFPRYSGEEMWDLNLQTFLYPLMLMNRFEEDIARFTYLVGDTKSGKLKMETRIRTREECENKLTEAMNLYREAQLFDERPTRRNKLCGFCSLGKDGTCPISKAPKQITRVDEDLDDLFGL